MKNIFVVDDSPTARASIKYTLEQEGYSIELAVDGVDALDKIKTHSNKIDVFLFDVNMPNMDGITLIKNVREISKYQFTPIIFLTTESQSSKKLEGKNAGASGWIVKPFRPEQLIEVIKRFVGV
ncbi:MAG: response regulator [Spirochaetales bacterium]|nr:response regulator [Spirochaetales bacterium]